MTSPTRRSVVDRRGRVRESCGDFDADACERAAALKGSSAERAVMWHQSRLTGMRAGLMRPKASRETSIGDVSSSLPRLLVWRVPFHGSWLPCEVGATRLVRWKASLRTASTLLLRSVSHTTRKGWSHLRALCCGSRKIGSAACWALPCNADVAASVDASGLGCFGAVDLFDKGRPRRRMGGVGLGRGVQWPDATLHMKRRTCLSVDVSSLGVGCSGVFDDAWEGPAALKTQRREAPVEGEVGSR